MLALLLAAAVSLPQRSPADYSLLEGRVTIATRSNEALVIAIDTNNDGSVDDLFWFWAAPAPSLKFYSEKALVEFRGDELVVMSIDTGELFAFTVGEPNLAQRALARTPSSAIYSGYGLTHTVGANVANIQMRQPQSGSIHANDDCTDFCVLYPDPDPGSGGGGNFCDSGGTGASQCSISNGSNSCSVSCVSGYYACCWKVCQNSCTDVMCRCNHN